jgi:hypothetical protein
MLFPIFATITILRNFVYFGEISLSRNASEHSQFHKNNLQYMQIFSNLKNFCKYNYNLCRNSKFCMLQRTYCMLLPCTYFRENLSKSYIIKIFSQKWPFYSHLADDVCLFVINLWKSQYLYVHRKLA